MYRYRGKGKQQAILLLLLFLQAISSEAWAQNPGDGTNFNPWKGDIGTQTLYDSNRTYYINGVTSGRIRYADDVTNITIVVRGHNKLYADETYAAIDPSNSAYNQNRKLTITTDDRNPELEVYGTFSNTSNHAGIGMYQSTVIIDGCIKVTAHEAGYLAGDIERGQSPGIGGAAIRGKYHPAGTLTLKNGARVYTEAKSTNIQDQQLPTIKVENFATISSNDNRVKKIENASYMSFEYTGFNGTKPKGRSSIQLGKTDKTGYIIMEAPYQDIYVHQTFAYLPFYKINDAVSSPILHSIAPYGYNVAKMGFLYDELNTYYSAVTGTYSTSNLYLNVNEYPISGILTAGKDVTFDGQGNSMIKRTLYTDGEGLLFIASGNNSFQLTDLTCASGNKIRIDKQVYLGENNNLGAGVMQDINSVAIYHRVTTLQNNTRVNKVTYGGVDIPNYYQPPGSNQLYLWLPNVSTKELRIETVEKMVYTNKSTISMTTSHSTDANDLLVIPTEFNVNASTISLNAATSGNQTVLYDSKSYSSPINTPIAVIGTTDKNSIILEGSGTANLVLKGATISTTANGVSPLQSNNITANITVNGVNALTASSAHALSKSGGTLTLQGASASDQLTVASNSPSHKDIYTLDRALIIKSSFNLRSQNRTVSPLVTIQDTPLIQFQQAGNWLTFSHTYMLASDIGNNTVLKTVKYKNGTEVSPDLYTANALVGQFYLWMPQSSEYMYITAGSLTYVLPSQATSHNKKLNVFAIPASIGDVYYDTLEEAFAAAVEGNTIKLRANCALTTNGTATLSKLAAGKAVTLQNDTYTLTSTSGYTLAAGSGTLKLDFSGSGKMAGPFTLSGSVYTTSAVANLGAFTRSGIGTVYRQLVSSLPTNTPTGQSLMCQAGTTTAYPAWNEGGQTCLWVPSGQQTTTIKDAAEPISTITTNLTAHGGTTPIAVWPVLNIQYGDIDVNGNTVTYGSKRYVQSVIDLSAVNQFRITGTSTTKKVTTAGTTFIDLNVLAITAPSGTSAFSVNGGTADITVTGTNSLTGATNNHGIHVATGTLNLSGTGTLTASGPGTGQDIYNQGVMTISGTPTLVAANSRFRPTATINAGSPIIKLGSTIHYRASLPVAGVGTISNLRYADNRAVVDVNLYTAAIGDKYYFWMPTPSRQILLDGTVPVAGSVFILPSRNFTHNAELKAAAAAAAIDTDIYPTLSDAFAAAIKGKTIVLKSNYTLSNSEKATLNKLSAGESVTLQTGSYTLIGTSGCLLSAEKGTLKLDISGSGTMLGVYHLQGFVYSASAATQLNQASFSLGGITPVYRTLISGLPTQLKGPLIVKASGNIELPAWYEAANAKACLWLPDGEQAIRIQERRTVNEPVASVAHKVEGNHANTAIAIPLPDITYGNITVEAATGGTTTVTYGSIPQYTVPLTGLSTDKRLPVHGVSTQNNLTIKGAETAYLSLREISIQPAGNLPAVVVQSNGKADLELYKSNLFKGGQQNSPSAVQPALQLAAGSSVTLNGSKEGTGRLEVRGGALFTISSPAVTAATGASFIVKGGTLMARNGDGTQDEAIQATTSQVIAGSVDALFAVRPTNGSKNVYKVAVTTGLNPGQPYLCTYNYPGAPVPINIMPDADGKIYCWLPEQDNKQENRTKVMLTHPVSNEKTEIEIVKVETHDSNVAPVVLEMENLTTGSAAVPYGNLKDAFDAITEGTQEARAHYNMQLLTRVSNLRTAQVVKPHTSVSLDLGSFELLAQNGSGVAFDASASGAYLQVTGKGNIKNSFRIEGDVFITGVVPLTDAVVELNGEAVFRTLVKELPAAAGNTYSYSYGQKQNVPFNLHDGLACLWLPDYGRAEELRFTVTGTTGLSTEYTAGSITTVTQRTEAIPAIPVGVVARLTYKDSNAVETSQAFNTLTEAFAAAKNASQKARTDIVVSLLTGTTVQGTLTVEGTFALELEGKSLLSSGGKLVVTNGSRLVLTDHTTGIKGSFQTLVQLLGSGQLFVPASIRVNDNVTKDSNEKNYFWRTLVNMAAMPGVTEVVFQNQTYPVIGGEVCLWLPENKVDTTPYTLKINGTDKVITGYTVSTNHDNEMSVGESSTEARYGNTEGALEELFTLATGEQTPIELLKVITLKTEIIVQGKPITLDVGKYGLDPAPVNADIRPITLATGSKLVVKSQTGTGRLLTPLQLNGGQLYIGPSVTGDKIGTVTAVGNSKKLYRLLITNLPATIPTESYEFTYQTMESSPRVITDGSLMVRDGIACLWLNEAVAGQLLFTVGSSTIRTDNVTINPNHFNTESYGVSEVAQIMNGKKYTDLADALNNAAGKTITLLKNAALKRSVSVNGSVVLKMDGYSITAQSESGGGNATLSVNATSNLQITGKGNITTDFRINASTNTHSNGNLQVDEEVILNSTVMMDGQPMLRTSVKGLPVATREVHYSYGRSDDNPNLEQQGDVIAYEGTLCLWLNKRFSTPQNLFVDVKADGQTYLATSVVIEGHINPVMVMKVGAIAAIGNETYDTLTKAFEAADGSEAILLRKNTSLSDVLTLPDAVTTTVSLNLDKNTITATSATFDANKGHLLLTNGSLTGTLALTDNVYAGGDVMMNNATVSKDSRTVWRTLLALPQVTPIISEFSYKLGTTGTSVKCTNIQTVDDRQVACLWLPSSSAAQALTVEAGSKVYTLTNVTIASTHGNELDATDNNPAAAIGEKEYASLAAALAAVKTAGETITLKKDLALSSLQSIQETVTLNMEGRSFTSNYGGFEVSEGKTLTLTGGQLLGTIRLPGKGHVNADKSVKIAGIILNNEADEVFRALVKVNTDTRCLWIISAEVEQDQEIEVTPDIYEVTLPAHLSNHNTTLTAYKRVTLTAADAEWKDEYANTNVVLTSTAIWNVGNAPATGAALHRLTINDGAKVKTGAAQVLAADGIRYIRSFAAKEIWQSIALPYTATRITAHLTVKEADGKEVEKLSALVPASGSGTAGHFWLRTIQSDGSTQNVTTSEMTANMAYIMAVPEALSGKPITFVSAPNQLLRRDKVLAVKPVKGFAAYANGALDALTIGEPCYILTPDGKLFKREATYTVLPFRGYLLADAATTAAMPEIRMDVVTDVPQITDRSDLRVYTEGRYIILEATRPEPVWIYSFNGYCLRSFIAPAGRTAIEAGDGFYLVNRTKVVVRSHY